MKKVLTFSLIILSSILYCQPNPDAVWQMVLYYPVENFIKEDSVIDISGYNTNGKLHNVNLVEDRHGNENGAIEFNGYNSYISMDCPYFSQTAYCYSVWAKIYQKPEYGTAQLLIDIGTEYGVDHFLMNTLEYSLNNHTGLLGGGYHKDGTHAIVRTQTFPELGVWQQILYMRSDSILKLYINGELVVSSTENVQEPYFGDDFTGRIGSRINGTQFFIGALDDIRIFERMLDDDEIDLIQTQDQIPEPFVNAGSDTIISNSTSEFQLNGQAYVFKELEWTTSGDGTFSNEKAKAPIYYPGAQDLLSGKIVNLSLTAEGYDPNRSLVSDTIRVMFLSESGIFENSNREFSVYPNPTSNLINISAKNSNNYSIKIFDQLGKLVLIDQNSETVDISNMSNGLYYIEIENSEGKRFSQKIIKQ
ncbi:MAG TPA: LamG-like jellyroll fold domain-containing protein [Bacteroidales bacterium]